MVDATEGKLGSVSGRYPTAVLIAVGVLALSFAGPLLLYSSSYPLHHDLAGSVLSGRLAITLGDTFGDYSSYFPPAERVWFSVAAQISQLTGLRLDLCVVAMSAAVVLFGASFGYYIRRVTTGASALFFIGSLAALTITPILFKNVFGLREHMIAVGLWPYLVLRVSDPESTLVGWRLRTVVGLFMGATLLLKYLYSIVVLLVELGDTLVQRRPLILFRLENLVSGAIVFVYLFLWLGIDPSQREAVGAMFSAIDANLASPMESWINIIKYLVFAAMFAILCRFFAVPPRSIVLAFATVTGAVIAAALQERWYTHHLFPISVSYIFWWWLAGRQLKWWGHFAVLAYLVPPVAIQFLITFSYVERVEELDEAVRASGQSVAGKRVGILSLHPSPYNEYLTSHDAIRWNPMMNIAYVAAELQSFDSETNNGKDTPPLTLSDPGRRLLHDQMINLWQDHPPDVLILDQTYRWPLKYIEVDWAQAYANDIRYEAIMAHYRPVIEHQGRRLKFTYYVRTD